MSAEPFNSLGGFSVNIPPIQVVDANGNVVTNVLALSGNVAANAIYSDNYRYANGAPFTGGNAANPGGSNTQLQFNNNGSFGGIPNATWNGNTLSLGNVSELSIGGGSTGYFLRTDGNGALSWAAGVSNSTPGGSNTQVQFNDAGALAGNIGLTFDKDTSTLSVLNANITGNVISANITATGNANFSGDIVSLGAVSNLKIDGGNTGQVLTTDGAGNLSFTTPSGAQGGNIYVFTRSSGTVYIEVQFGSIIVVGRTGNVSIPVQA